MTNLIDKSTQWLKKLWALPWGELSRFQKAVRFSIDLGRFGANQLQQDRASEMAAALAFRTLFGLLPVLVVTSVLVKAMAMQEHIMKPLESLFSFWGLDTVRILVPTGNGEEVSSTTTLAIWLRDRVREAESVNVAAIGWVGVLVTIYAAISLVVTIEECFNVIYRAPQGRSWTRRIPIYWFFLTLSPLLLLVGTNLNGRLDTWLGGTQASIWLAFGAGLLWSLLVIWLLMFAVYYLIPNTRVHIGPALVGSLVSAVLLEIGKRTLGLYLENALSLSQLYGSLGLIPLFMFWVYLMWLAILFGLQVSSTLQHLHGRQLDDVKERRQDLVLTDPLTLVSVMVHVGKNFQKGKATTIEDLTRVTGLPENMLGPILKNAMEANLVHEVASPQPGFVLAAPPSELAITHIMGMANQWIEAGRGAEVETDTVRQLRHDQQMVAGQKTLADLLPPLKVLPANKQGASLKES